MQRRCLHNSDVKPVMRCRAADMWDEISTFAKKTWLHNDLKGDCGKRERKIVL